MSELKSNYKISKINNLVIVAQLGILNLNSMMEFIKTLNSDPLFSTKFNQIVDLNETILDLTFEDINKYVEHLENNSTLLGVKKIALITNTPNQVVYSTLFKEAQEQLQPLQSVQIFSTLKSAYNFVEKENISFEEVSITLNQLKKSS